MDHLKFFRHIANSGFQKYKTIHLFLRRILESMVVLFILFQVLNLSFPLNARVEYSTIVLASDSTLVNAFLTSDDKWRMYTELNEITQELKKAIIYKEDRFFRFHFGINPVAVFRAFANNIRTGKRTSGASTITMQVARLLEPKERTYWNKFIEMFRALQLEWRFSKEEILQLYLNLVPYGSNIEGVKAASVIYLGKMPNHLSLAEIAALSIIPNRPVSLRMGKNNELILQERNKWLKRYQAAKLFPEENIEDAFYEPLKAYRRPIPNLAPHLSYKLKQEHPHSSIIRTTLNLEFQRKCETIVETYSKAQYYNNIKNATALIIDNSTRSVLAYIGSANFYNEEDGGQVDGIKAVRSPGSTLKPLVYALAIDQGLITPKSVVSDVPVSFGGYEPENYDGTFYGNITVEQALARSLNIPAVKLLAGIKTHSLLTTLEKAGFEQIKKDKDHLGLSTVLGGCGTSLLELTALYCSFANNGIYSPLNYLSKNKQNDSILLVSQEATFMVTDILTQLTRPDLPIAWENSLNTPKIAWKTGTSYGRKDAWSIGFNNKYTVGVWVGNFSGEGVPDLSGSEKATPLLFRIFNAIENKQNFNWFATPPDLGHRYVCSQTGFLPNDYCHDLILDYYIPGVSDTRVCSHLKKVFVNPDSSLSFCLSCRPELGYKEAFYPNLEPEIISYYNANQVDYQRIPPHNPECERFLSGKAPVITSPVDKNEYFVNVEEDMEIMLSCHANNDVEKVYWYINKRFFKEARKEEQLFFTPNEGNIEISCSDDKGRNTTITIEVTYTDM
jgi:penicillin-binding protein 1C